MAESIMFIFLLDSLPGQILNQSLELVQKEFPNHYDVKKCNYKITDPLLQIISRELDALVTPNWLTFEDKLLYFNASHKVENLPTSEEQYTNFRKSFDSSSLEIRNLNSFDVLDRSDSSDLNIPEIKVEDLNESREVEIADLLIGVKDPMHPGKVPFLVAIFESLTNMTAQTCAGTLISPNWVLTAAGCVNLLNKMYHNLTNTIENSTYTIIAEATDPLVDGTAHNVTEIQINLNPVDMTHYHLSTEDMHHLKVDIGPAIALMNIEPPVKGVESVELAEHIAIGEHVIVYGWATTKEKNDSLHIAAFDALTISASECAINYNMTVDSVKASFDTCLTTNDENADVINQISWGGPIVSRSGLILAVARGEDHAPLSGGPIGPHLPWIRSVIHDHDPGQHR